MRGLIDRDALILQVLKKLQSPFRKPGSKEVWDTGWEEILERVRRNQFSPELLKPQYFRGDEICRKDGEYTHAEQFYEMDHAIRKCDFANYLREVPKIVEIGCGTGINQLLLAEMFPEAELVAADWAKASQEIVAAISANLSRAIKPVNFNMFTLDGWENLGIDEKTAVLTVHALEQIGADWGLLLTALRKARPRICVHIEPLLELYDETKLFDWLAAEYHRTRDYLAGWLPAIQELQRQGKAEILACYRRQFGNLYHEAYSILVWKPIGEQ